MVGSTISNHKNGTGPIEPGTVEVAKPVFLVKDTVLVMFQVPVTFRNLNVVEDKIISTIPVAFVVSCVALSPTLISPLVSGVVIVKIFTDVVTATPVAAPPA